MNYKNTKVLILGLGLNEGGVGSARFFAKQGADVLVTDKKDETTLKPSLDKLKDFPNIKYHLGKHQYEDLDWADLIIRNQALKPDNPYLKYAREKGKEIKTDMGVFLSFVNPKQVIGITGTKGKSTTSSMVYEVLKGFGKKALLSGNIGKSVLDDIEKITAEETLVLELSSFQLEAWRNNTVSPHIALITNIFPDHLNYYENFSDYVAAKKLIAINQTEADFLFLNKDYIESNRKNFTEGIKSRIVHFSAADLPKTFSPKLPGDFNKTNFAAALAIAKILNLNTDKALAILENFSGIDFRMQLVKESNGIKIYNNTSATGPESAIESLKTFPGCILICGGMNKGLEYGQFAKAIGTFAKEVFLLEGDATEELKVKSEKLKDKKTYNNLEDLLTDVKEIAKSGDIVLFSPGGTSFNLFQNEFDRGRKFNAAVEKVFN